MLEKAFWIEQPERHDRVVPAFLKTFTCEQAPLEATLEITADGVYEAFLNDQRIGDFIMAPAWTVYEKRLQVQSYDVTSLLQNHNQFRIFVAEGWSRGPLAGWIPINKDKPKLPAALIAELTLRFADGRIERIVTDESWTVSETALRYCDLYDGEIYDARFTTDESKPALVATNRPKSQLIPQEGEAIREQERIRPLQLLHTPAGETVLDFGQNLTGYVSFHVTAKAGDRIRISHAEVLDKHGNFYTDNYRSAKAQIEYICIDGSQSYKPSLTFYGFRYIRIDEFPGDVDPAAFEAIVLHSDMKRTGWLDSSSPLLNRLFSNIVWGQKGNFVDVPTDCPQRDERLGWTGDAQVFARTASLQFDVLRFFKKWLLDLAACQGEDGLVPDIVPDVMFNPQASAAWGDAVTIVPWEVYLTYGDISVLENQFESMTKWLGYIESRSQDPYLWTGCIHYEDWLGLDAAPGEYKGASRKDFIASAFYAYSCQLTIKSGRALGRDVSTYEKLYDNIVRTFRETFTDYRTQTEHTLAIYFNLSTDLQKTGDALAQMVIDNGHRLTTGFVGTPYLLHALSRTGHTDIAYKLLLQENYPSWLFSVKLGATTMWEHWDGINEDGDFWSANMNSFNHYAYGAVADWVFTVATGIQVVEEAPGFEQIHFAPQANPNLEYLNARLETKHGEIYSGWYWQDGRVRYEIHTPVAATAVIDGTNYELAAGKYIF